MGSGLNNRTSDIVTRTTVTPASWFDVTARTRLDKSRLTPRFVDAQASTGVPLFRLSAGYIYTATNPYYSFDQAALPATYFQHRNEITVGASSSFLEHYKVSAYGRQDVNLGKPTAVGVHATYEDECFIFDLNFNRRYTSLNGDSGSTLVLFQITLKTVGQFGYHAS